MGDCLRTASRRARKKKRIGRTKRGTLPRLPRSLRSPNFLVWRSLARFACQFCQSLPCYESLRRPGGRVCSSGCRSALFGGLFAENNILPAVLHSSQVQELQVTWNQSLKTWPKNKRRFVSFSGKNGNMHVHCVVILKLLSFDFCRKIENEQRRKKLVDRLENKERKRSMRKGRQRYETNPHTSNKLLIVNKNLIEQKCPCLYVH